MPSTFSHAAVALAAGTVFASRPVPKRFWWASVGCAVIADVDVILLGFGIPYDHFFGHRGFFHSLFFGLLVSLVALRYISAVQPEPLKVRIRYFSLFFLLSASHGLLDALSNGSIGVALFSAFDSTRYFFPWQPISMVRMRVFFSTWSFEAIQSELLCIWLPSSLVVLATLLMRTVSARTALRP